MKVILSILFWIVAAVTTLLLFLVSSGVLLVSFPFDRKRKLVHAQGFWWADTIIGFNPFWSLSVEGAEHIDPKKTYVVVANHQSFADILMLYKTRMQFKWVAKESLFKIPIFGWCMSLVNHIKLARGQHGSIRVVYRQAASWLKKGVSVFFFPEGTRSATGEMNDFKNGAFKLAIKEKKPILPIYIKGGANVLPKGSWIFNTRAFCKLTILPAINTQDLSPKDFASLRDKTYATLIEASQ